MWAVMNVLQRIMTGTVNDMKPTTMRQLWATAKNYGMDSEMLHNLLFSELSKEHISKLSEREAKYLIDRIKGKDVPKPAPRGRASNEQKKYIRDLAAKLGWDDNPARLSGFIKKYAKIDNIDWLTAYQASKIIEALKRMVSDGKDG